MANHGAAALLLIASLLVAVALSGTDARPTTVRPKAAAALVRAHLRLPGRNTRLTLTVRRDAHGGYVVAAAPPAPLPVGGLLPPVVRTCSKVHGVKAGDTCFAVSQGAGLGLDKFLGLNPNINCKGLFVGQWVCLEA